MKNMAIYFVRGTSSIASKIDEDLFSQLNICTNKRMAANKALARYRPVVTQWTCLHGKIAFSGAELVFDSVMSLPGTWELDTIYI